MNDYLTVRNNLVMVHACVQNFLGPKELTMHTNYSPMPSHLHEQKELDNMYMCKQYVSGNPFPKSPKAKYRHMKSSESQQYSLWQDVHNFYNIVLEKMLKLVHAKPRVSTHN